MHEVLPRTWPQDVCTKVGEAIAGGRAATVHEAIAALDALPEPLRGRRFRLLVTRTFTLETQLDAVKLALAVLPCSAEIHVAPLETIEQVLLDPESSAMRAKPDAVLVLWRLEELLPRLLGDASATQSERSDMTDAAIARIERLCKGYIARASAPLFLSTLPLPAGIVSDLADLHRPHGWHEALLRLNQAMLRLAAASALLHVFDFAGWAAAQGRGAFDVKMDLFARQPIAAAHVASFGAALASTLAPLVRVRAKVLAIDLDNLLWGGVVGEDGIAALKVGHDFPGSVYRRIQQALLALKERGVLLVLLSKNNTRDVEEAFGALPDMPLKLSDFAAVRINWKAKHENLRSIAEELNLGLDSFVFLDDQAFEREQMAFELPQVKVLATTEDPLRILQTLSECRDFDTYRVSAEDLARSADYRAQTLRRELEAGSDDAQSFLETLGLKAVIAPVDEGRIGRVVQMLAKTNQFNVTTRRHSEAEVRRMVRDASNVLLTLSLSDRFGDQGIVGLAIGVADGDEMLRIDSLLLSCRAIGRGAEQALFRSLAARAHARGYRSIAAEYVRTAKNEQVADLFERLGMETVERTENRSAYRMQLPPPLDYPAWMQVVEDHEQHA